jgi:predicted Zn-dependent protease
MHRILSMVVFCLALVLSGAPADAQEQKQSRQKGIYEEVDLTSKDYHLIESSDELHVQFLRRGMLYGDPELDAWLQSIGDKLAPEPTDFYQKYRFYLIRDPSPNAFALPDGRIYVHTGLIGRMQNEAQLASLLAHEINHVAGHHGVLAYRSQKRKAKAGIFLSLTLSMVGAANTAPGGVNWGEMAGMMTQVGFVWSILGYSRDLEEEADINGYERLLEAGYDVREMPKLYDILGHDFEGLQPRLSTKWSTHPELVSRGEYMQARVGGTPEGVIDILSLGPGDFRQKVRPLALVAVEDYILDDYGKSALALSRQLVEEDPADLRGWNAVGYSHIALGPRSEYEEAPEPTTKKEDPEAASAYRGMGIVHQQRGNYREAGAAFMKYLKQDPDAPDRPIVMADLQKLAKKIKAESGD